MSLDSELRSRVDQLLRELGDVLGSLHHIKRLADGHHQSADQLSKVVGALEVTTTQLKPLLESVSQSASALASGAEALKAADPKMVVTRVAALQTAFEALLVKSEANARAQISALERVEKSIAGKLDQTGEAIGRRVGMAIKAVWLSAGMAAVAAALSAIALLR